MTQKRALFVFVSRNAIPQFGNFAAPNPYNYVAAHGLYGTQASIRGLNRWEYKWSPLSQIINAKQRRWRENSYVFQFDRYFYHTFMKRVSGIRKHRTDLSRVHNEWGECKL